MADSTELSASRLERERFLGEANAAFAALRDDPHAWSDEQRERHLWEATLEDDPEDIARLNPPRHA